MDNNRLEKIPGEKIAPLTSPVDRQGQWTIPGYTEDRNADWWILWNLFGVGFAIFRDRQVFCVKAEI